MLKVASRSLHSSLLLLISISIAFFFFRFSLNQKLGPIDDHEIVTYLGNDQQFTILDIPRTLMQQTEIGQWGEYPRYRPIYYSFRLLETSFFGTNAAAWYSFRILLVAVSAFLLSTFISRNFISETKIGRLALFLIFSVAFYSLPAWADIATRLGPSEIYLVTGFSLFVTGCVLVYSEIKTMLGWVCTIFGALVMIGSKENGIFALLPLSIIYVIALKKYPTKKVATSLSYFFTIGFSLFVFLGWYFAARKTGNDMYDRSIGFKSIVQGSVSYLSSKQSLTLLLLIFIMVFLWYISKRLNSIDISLKNQFSKTMCFISMSSIIFYLWIVFEFAFYRGDISYRYGIITQVSVLLILALFLTGLLNLISMFLKTNSQLVSVYVLSATICFAFAYLPAKSSANTLKDIGTSKSYETSLFQDRLSTILDEINYQKSNAIILQVNGIWDYEPAFAMTQYLNYWNSVLPMYLLVDIPSVNSDFEQRLLNQLISKSENGDLVWGIDPFETSLTSRNYCITFNGSPPNPTYCGN